MMCQTHEVMLQQHSAPRWKEWIPLATQQLRLRNLIQIIAYNIKVGQKHNYLITRGINIPSKSDARINKTKVSFYYTLHLTTMSAPFYTSEKLENENPKWSEIEMGELTAQVNTAVNGVVVRLWMHCEGEQDQVVTVWGVYFSGLMYLGPRFTADPLMLNSNTIVFYMQGGYFTASHCFRQVPPKTRNMTVILGSCDAHPSYNVNSLLRLHRNQQAIKKQIAAAQNLREKISIGGFSTYESKESAVLRRLLNKSRPKAPQRRELLKIKKEIELVKFRVTMLSEEKARKQKELHQLQQTKHLLSDANQDRGLELMGCYQTLHKDIERLKEWKKGYIDTREAFLHSNAYLTFRRKQLISELNLIYPVAQLSDKKYTICGVHLPNSEDFVGNDEVMISVALGFVAHLVHMISVFLQVPLRYPIYHFGSRSKIIDHIAEKIPEKEREFPLFARGKEKLQFNYGVYLLNKNIAQLRWYCGLPTQDLRATLPNLTSLLHLRPGAEVVESSHRTFSGSLLDLRSSSQNVSPVGSLQTTGLKRMHPAAVTRHRVSKSMGSSELGFSVKIPDVEVQSAKDLRVAMNHNALEAAPAANLSYSLDKGLDEYEEIKKAEDTTHPATNVVIGGAMAHVGSEPILTPDVRDKIVLSSVQDTASSGDEGQRRFLQSWQARGPAPICSDDDAELIRTLPHEHKHISGFAAPTNGIHTQQTSTDNGSPCSVEHSTEAECLLHEHEYERKASQCTVYLDCEDDIFVSNGFHQVNESTNSHSDSNGSHLFSNNGYSQCEGEHYARTTSKEQYSYSKTQHDEVESCREADEGGLEVNSLEDSLEFAKYESAEDVNDVMDSLFANVASRTEALANRTTSFNLVRSRHGSTLEDSPS